MFAETVTSANFQSALQFPNQFQSAYAWKSFNLQTMALKCFILPILVFVFNINAVRSEKFDFGIFENFVANAEIFTLERDIVHQLETTREMLTRNANAIRSFNNNKVNGHSQRLARDLTYQKSIQL